MPLLAFVIITAISCTKDEETPIPTIAFKTGENYVSTDTTMVVGTNFTMGIRAESSSAKNITNVKVIRKLDGGTPENVIDSTTAAPSLSLSWPLTSSGTDGFYEEFTCEVSDANKMTNSVSFTVYTVPADPGIIIYSNVVLASFNLNFDHFLSLSNGVTYDTAQCKETEIQELIDIVYYDNMVTGHTIMSPDVAFLNDIYPSMEYWTIRNETMFSKTEITSGAFQAIESIDELNNAFINAVPELTLEFIDNNEEGQVFAFITEEGVKGLINITDTQSSANYGESILTFDVKIEKNVP